MRSFDTTYLDLGKILGLGGKVESTEADTNGTTGNENNSMALSLELEDGLDNE